MNVTKVPYQCYKSSPSMLQKFPMLPKCPFFVTKVPVLMALSLSLSLSFFSNLLLKQTEFKMFVNHSSAAEICTTRASINRTGKTNAAKRVENHYNEYCEFHAREVEAHKCTSFMEMIEMEKISGKTTFNWVVVTF